MKSWWQRRTLRFRLALWYAFGSAVLLTLFCSLLYGFVSRRMAQPLNGPLMEDLETIHRHLSIGPDLTLRWNGQELPVTPDLDDDDPWFELWDEQGRLVRRHWPFAGEKVERTPAPPVRGVDTLSVIRIAKDIRLRLFSTPFRQGDHDWMIRVLRIHEPAQEALGALLGIIMLSLPAVVALLVIGGYLITRHWLKPLERMAAEAEGITADNLGRRLPEEDEAELGRLAGAFNRTLGRLEDSFRTLDRFVADASHELRTPLTTLRNVGEVGLRRSRTVEEYREIIGSMLEEAQRLHQLVERLLELASADGGARLVHRERLRLDQLAAACVNELGILAESKNQQIIITAAPCLVAADPVLLRQALQNLLDNAMKYSPADAKIRVTVETRSGECRVTVADEGPGIPPGHAAKIADRFYRLEDSRERGRGGFGLGLAITKAYLRVMDGRLEYAPGDPRGSCFSLVLAEDRGE